MSPDTPAFETLSVEPVDEHVTIIRLNRPDASNALNSQMGRDLVRYFEDVALDPKSMRCIVLTGAGDKAFCAGGDLKERNGMTDEAWTRQHVIFERMVRALIDCPVPIIARRQRRGLWRRLRDRGCCCDFVYAAEPRALCADRGDARHHARRGGTQNLPRAVGERRAKELILTGKPFTAAKRIAGVWSTACVRHAELLQAALATARAHRPQRADLGAPGQAVDPSRPADCRCGTASRSRSRPITAWSRPRTAARACWRSTRSGRRTSGAGEAQSNRLGV